MNNETKYKILGLADIMARCAWDEGVSLANKMSTPEEEAASCEEKKGIRRSLSALLDAEPSGDELRAERDAARAHAWELFGEWREAYEYSGYHREVFGALCYACGVRKSQPHEEGCSVPGEVADRRAALVLACGEKPETTK